MSIGSYPILEVIVDIVSWFINLFAAHQARHLLSLDSIPVETIESVLMSQGFKRRLQGLEPHDDTDPMSRSNFEGLHEQMYPKAATAGRNHWSNRQKNQATKTELENMLAFIDANPIHSFSYYWTVHRPCVPCVRLC